MLSLGEKFLQILGADEALTLSKRLGVLKLRDAIEIGELVVYSFIKEFFRIICSNLSFILGFSVERFAENLLELFCFFLRMVIPQDIERVSLLKQD